MSVIVQKYGGVLLATPQGREEVAAQVIATRSEGARVVVVASAIGREGDPYATDTLLGLATQVDPTVSPRTLDLLLSCGEIISTALLAHTLERAGAPAVALTGLQAGIQTTGDFGEARILHIDPIPIRAHLDGGRIAVVAGFQGVTAEQEVTTLGRGGSDTTAIALGAALPADLVEIYKDVEGVMTADPKVVPESRVISQISYDEVSQMAALGARVIHPRAADIGREHDVRVVIRRMGSGRTGGTLLVRGPELGVPISDGRPVIALAHLPDVVQLRLRRPAGESLTHPLKALRRLAAEGISIDLITLMSDLLAFTVREEDYERAVRLLQGEGYEASVTRPCAKVSIIGAGMRGVPGVMARVVKALEAAEAEILQTADSHTTISCLVRREQMERALRGLHDEFGLGEAVASEREAPG
ncbi:MAG TPA: aspartate kinase [bacterium]|jgi:aspartate kinase|nr:aspartate kinase [bacterium]